MSAGKSVYTVRQLLNDMDLNGDVLVYEAKSEKGGGRQKLPPSEVVCQSLVEKRLRRSQYFNIPDERHYDYKK